MSFLYFRLVSSLKTTNYKAGAFASKMMVPSGLDTLRMVVLALATTSGYSVMVGSEWGSGMRKMEM